MTHFLLFSLATSLLAISVAEANENLKGCRSVHLWYAADDGIAFYNEVTVNESALGTYFMICGWDKGYYGIQQLPDGKKLLIFSVWDSAQNGPNSVAMNERVELLYKDVKVRAQRFDHEGSGDMSFFDFNWKVGNSYRFLVTAKLNGNWTEYSNYFYLPQEKIWKHLATFSTVTGGTLLRGYYSFIEDFKRDGISSTKVHSSSFGNGWVKTKNGKWVGLTSARFTADLNPGTNINAGVKDDHFFLATGGATTNSDVKLEEMIRLSDKDQRIPPDDLPPIDLLK
jgi:hypothetical protein